MLAPRIVHRVSAIIGKAAKMHEAICSRIVVVSLCNSEHATIWGHSSW